MHISMNTPTSASENPLLDAWNEALASIKPLAPFLVLGFILTVIMNFAIHAFTSGFSFVFSDAPPLLPWLPIIIVTWLLLAWYGVHLLLALDHYRKHQSLLHPAESLRFLPRLIGLAVLITLIIFAPFIFLLSVAFGWLSMMDNVASAQELLNITSSTVDQITLGTSSAAAFLARAANTIGAGPIFLALFGGIIWALYASIRLSQASLAILLENAGIIEAIKRSWRLTKGSFWYIVGWGIVFAIGASLFTAIGGAIDTALGSISSGVSDISIVTAATQAFITAPLAGYYSFNIFTNLKKRLTPQSTAKAGS